MPCKDYLRIASLGGAIALGLLVHSGEHRSAPQADSWAGPIEQLKPVPVEIRTLPATAVLNA